MQLPSCTCVRVRVRVHVRVRVGVGVCVCACTCARAACVCVDLCYQEDTGFCNNVAHQLIDRAKVSRMFSCILAGGPGLQLRTWSNEAKQLKGKP